MYIHMRKPLTFILVSRYASSQRLIYKQGTLSALFLNTGFKPRMANSKIYFGYQVSMDKGDISHIYS